MLTDTTISDLIAKLGRLDPAPGVGGGYRPLDAGEVAAATLLACREAAIPALMAATKSDHWVVRYRSADVLGIILGSEAGVPALVGLLSDANWQVRQSAILALLGEVKEDLAARYPGHSAIIEYCHRALRFDVLTLLSQHGTAEIRSQTDRLLKQKRVPDQQIVLDASLDNPVKKRVLLALNVDGNRVCDQIEEKGTEQERASAAQFRQYLQLVRGGNSPVTSPEELLRGAGFSPTIQGRQELMRGANKPEEGAASSSVLQPGWRLVWPWPWRTGRSSRGGVVASALPTPGVGVDSSRSAPAAVVSIALPAPSLEEYARRTCALVPVADMEMILIPAGEFTMGSNDNAGEKPVHKVFLDSYYICKTPVTVRHYRTFCAKTGRSLPKPPDWGWKDDHPIVNVSWDDAQAYCDWAGGQLPTEAQWEKAARGTDGRKFPWGNVWDGNKCANSVKANNLKSTMPVGSYPSGASPYGVLDVAGNVWQWCSDWYDENYYKTSPNRNPSGPASGRYRVLRGGSWDNFSTGFFRCAIRSRNSPAYWIYYLGFWCVVRSDTR